MAGFPRHATMTGSGKLSRRLRARAVPRPAGAPKEEDGTMKVQDVMTTEVVSVLPGATLKEAARLLVEHRISGMPIVGSDGTVLGVLSEGDLLIKEQGEPRSRGRLALLIDPLDASDRAKLDARLAGEAMTSPALTISKHRPVAVAAKLMVESGMNRLPVVEDGKLIGIVTRADLVRAFIRDDTVIETEIRDDVIARSMWLKPNTVQVEVEDGEVTLAGRVDSEADAELLVGLVSRVPGVVDITSRLSASGLDPEC
jgi:CBS domain-containing protein